MDFPRWWHFGLFGGYAVAIVALVNAIASIPRFFTEDLPGFEFALLPFAVFGIGLLCGAVVWVCKAVSSSFGAAGGHVRGV